MALAEDSVACVAVDVALDRLFDYEVPSAWRGRIKIGMRVKVSFGRRVTRGYVVKLAGESNFDNLKPLLGVDGEEPFISETLVRLARWMATYYCGPLERALRTVLPAAVQNPGKGFRQLLQVQPVEGDDTDAAQEVTPRQAEVLRAIRARGGGLLKTLLKELQVSPGTVRKLEQLGLVRIEKGAAHRRPLANRTIVRTEALTLMDEQAAAVDLLSERLRSSSSKPILLYGVTGSGKTEVYLQSIAKVIASGKQAAVLVPEIALTPQTVNRFIARFGERVAVLHSRLSDGERHDEWHRIRAGEADVVIGPRSAVFAPFPRLGLIVVDEEHEPSYKQEQQPRYHARDVAIMRGYFESCPVMLGSATPALESWHNAREGKYELAVLPRRADERELPMVHILDMRQEAERAGMPTVFSQELLSAIQQRLDCGEQCILFLNRRGYSTSLVCKHCGFVARCDHCSVSHTYHRADERLRCHICGDSRKVPESCPACQDPTFKHSGIGTQRVETILAKCFPKARLSRMDADTTTGKHSHDEILGAFRSGQIDILVGTQMIAKGLHFPNVTLVGVLHADMSLHIPDFRAGERTFQLLAQVSGRAGRGEVPGEVYVQSYTPFHPAVQAARHVDFEGFAEQEMAFREELGYPPFGHLLCVLFTGKLESDVSQTTARVQGCLATMLPATVVLSDATPAPLARAKTLFRYQLILRGPRVSEMTRPLRAVLSTLKCPKGVKIAIDVDALSLL